MHGAPVGAATVHGPRHQLGPVELGRGTADTTEQEETQTDSFQEMHKAPFRDANGLGTRQGY